MTPRLRRIQRRPPLRSPRAYLMALTYFGLLGPAETATLRSIGREWGVSPERVRQLINRFRWYYRDDALRLHTVEFRSATGQALEWPIT